MKLPCPCGRDLPPKVLAAALAKNGLDCSQCGVKHSRSALLLLQLSANGDDAAQASAHSKTAETENSPLPWKINEGWEQLDPGYWITDATGKVIYAEDEIPLGLADRRALKQIILRSNLPGIDLSSVKSIPMSEERVTMTRSRAEAIKAALIRFGIRLGEPFVPDKGSALTPKGQSKELEREADRAVRQVALEVIEEALGR